MYIVVQSAICQGERLLNHVGGIDASGQARVQTQGDHPPQPLPVPAQQLAASARIPLAGPAEQLLSIGLLRGHENVSL